MRAVGRWMHELCCVLQQYPGQARMVVKHVEQGGIWSCQLPSAVWHACTVNQLQLCHGEKRQVQVYGALHDVFAAELLGCPTATC
jgi:hypothetical protein